MSQFNFDTENEKYIDGFFRHLENPQITSPFLTYNPSKKVEQIIKEIKQAISLFGKDLGYDLKLRIPGNKNIRFVKKTDLNKKYNSGVFKSEIRGVLDPKTFIIYICIDNTNKSYRDNYSIAHSINHKLIHYISYKKIHISKKDKSFRIARSGLRHGNKYFFFDEAITELTNLYIIKKYWGKYPHLKLLKKNALSEISHKITLPVKAELKKLAIKENTGYDDILNIAQHDLLVGSSSILKKLPSAFLATIK